MDTRREEEREEVFRVFFSVSRTAKKGMDGRSAVGGGRRRRRSYKSLPPPPPPPPPPVDAPDRRRRKKERINL